MDTVGKAIAERGIAIRKRYGRYPVYNYEKGLDFAEQTWPEMDAAIDVVDPTVGLPDIPDYSKMKPEQLGWLPVNRADFRKRIRPLLPRQHRLNTFSRRLHDPRQWVWDEVEEDGGTSN